VKFYFIILAVSLTLVCFSLSGCTQQLNHSTHEDNTSAYNSTYYAISFRYPADWTLTESPLKGGSGDRAQLTYRNESDGFSLKVWLLPGDCGLVYFDDRLNLTVVETNSTISIGGKRARHELYTMDYGNRRDIESMYEVCHEVGHESTYKNIYYRFTWVSPEEDYPARSLQIQKVMDSVRFLNSTGN